MQVCTCDQGFSYSTGTTSHCTKIDSCTRNPCFPGVQCHDLVSRRMQAEKPPQRSVSRLRELASEWPGNAMSRRRLSQEDACGCRQEEGWHSEYGRCTTWVDKVKLTEKETTDAAEAATCSAQLFVTPGHGID